MFDKRDVINISNFTNCMANLKTTFKRRFEDFEKIHNLVQLLNGSFTLQPNGEWINEAIRVFNCNEASLQIEIIEFQSDYILKKYVWWKVFKNWQWSWWILVKICIRKKYQTLKLLPFKMCTMFGFTYVCESALLKTNYLKTKFKSRLTNKHLSVVIKTACINHTLNFKFLVERPVIFLIES